MPAADSLKVHQFYILLALAEDDRHGLGIARDVQALSEGRVRLWPATLYGTLDELHDRRWIEALRGPGRHPDDQSERKQYYRITAAGRRVLAHEADRMGRLARLARGRVRSGEAR